MPPEIAQILDFWFAAPGEPEFEQPRSLWFRKDPASDAAIRRRFGALVAQALAGELDAWGEHPGSLLALVLLLDQFTRNIHRDSALAFAGDAAALDLARRAVARGWDKDLPPLRRVFLYLPFEHSEAAADQAESLRLFRPLAAFPDTAGFLDWAERHAAVIARFGRFPHRNAALGRANTPEEQAYLDRPGAGF